MQSREARATIRACTSIDINVEIMFQLQDHFNGTVVHILLSSCIGYIATYAWRSPIFVVPADYAKRPVLSTDFQTACSLSYCLGYALGKPLGVSLFTSAWGVKHKAKLVIVTQVVSVTTCKLQTQNVSSHDPTHTHTRARAPARARTPLAAFLMSV